MQRLLAASFLSGGLADWGRRGRYEAGSARGSSKPQACKQEDLYRQLQSYISFGHSLFSDVAAVKHTVSLFAVVVEKAFAFAEPSTPCNCPN